MSDQGPWVTKTILELEERVAELTEEIEHLQDSLIRQGKMLRAIVNITKGQPKGNALHSTHDAVESVERLQARNIKMTSCLIEARENMQDWAMYVDKYFIEKHGLKDDLASIDKVLGSGEEADKARAYEDLKGYEL